MIKSVWQRVKKKFAKCPVVMHPLFIVFGLVTIVVRKADLFVMYTVLALLHEGAHYLVAKKLGYKMCKVRLMPFGAELFGETDEFADNDEILISLAGPVFNLLLCLALVTMWWIVPITYAYTVDMCLASLMLALFNLLPIFPLDGGRVLLAILSKTTTRETATKRIKCLTQVFAFILLGLFVLSLFWGINLSLGIAGIMLFASSLAPSDAGYVRYFCWEKRKRALLRGTEEVVVAVLEDVSLAKLYKRLSAKKLTLFKVFSGDGKELYMVSEEKLEELIGKNDAKTTLRAIFN